MTSSKRTNSYRETEATSCSIALLLYTGRALSNCSGFYGRLLM